MPATPISIPVIDNYTLDSFAITGVDVIPSTSAQIYVSIMASTGRVFARTVSLTGDDYAAWQSDTYLFEYVAAYLAAKFEP